MDYFTSLLISVCNLICSLRVCHINTDKAYLCSEDHVCWEAPPIAAQTLWSTGTTLALCSFSQGCISPWSRLFHLMDTSLQPSLPLLLLKMYFYCISECLQFVLDMVDLWSVLRERLVFELNHMKIATSNDPFLELLRAGCRPKSQ